MIEEATPTYYGDTAEQIHEAAVFYERCLVRKYHEIEQRLRTYDYYVASGDSRSAKITWDDIHSEENVRHFQCLRQLAGRYSWLKSELLNK